MNLRKSFLSSNAARDMSTYPLTIFLGNLWRVSSKLADKLLKRNGFQIVKGTGSRYTVKPVEDKKLETD